MAGNNPWWRGPCLRIRALKAQAENCFTSNPFLWILPATVASQALSKHWNTYVRESATQLQQIPTSCLRPPLGSQDHPISSKALLNWAANPATRLPTGLATRSRKCTIRSGKLLKKRLKNLILLRSNLTCGSTVSPVTLVASNVLAPDLYNPKVAAMAHLKLWNCLLVYLVSSDPNATVPTPMAVHILPRKDFGIFFCLTLCRALTDFFNLSLQVFFLSFLVYAMSHPRSLAW